MMLLPILHLFNDGYLAAMPLILPFASDEFGLSLGVVGLLGSLLSFSGIILAIPAGIASARFGSVRMLSLAALCYGIGFLILGAAAGLVLVTAAFVLGSIAFGLFHPVAFSAVARGADHGRLGRDMGIFAATGDIGRIAFAAAVTFLIGLTSWRRTAFIYGIAAIALAAVSIAISGRQPAGSYERTRKGALDRSVLHNKAFLLSNAASFLDSFANSSLFIFIPFLLTARGIDAAFVGLFTSVFFIGNLLGKLIMGQLSDRIGQSSLFICCEICIFIALILLAFAPSAAFISILALILGFFTKGTVPIISTMIAEAAGEGGYESAYSINSLSTSIANTAAPLFLGILADYLGIQSIFIACGMVAVLASVPAAFLHRTAIR